MIPRAIHQVFDALKTLREKSQASPLDTTTPPCSYTVKVSFLELHNEEWVDLLKDSVNGLAGGTSNRAASGTGGVVGTFGKRPTTPSSKTLKSASSTMFGGASEADFISIREDKDGRISIHGATNIVVATPEAALKLLAKGSKMRSTAATNMNETSSRSHAIFSLTLISTQMTSHPQQWHVNSNSIAQKQHAGGTGAGGLTISSKFHFVDLAGSERLKRTQNTGDRKAEGISINQGLLVLGRVINCLTETKTTSAEAVVPYRDSKLTRFLQDSLGGNSKTVMLACISALESDLPETINTLRYASRARGIQNKSRITVDTTSSSAEIIPLLSEISTLKSLLAESVLLRTTDQETITSLQQQVKDTSIDGEQLEALKKRIKILESKNHEMDDKFKKELGEGRRERDELLTEISNLKLNKEAALEIQELESQLSALKKQVETTELNSSILIREKEGRIAFLESSLLNCTETHQNRVAALEQLLETSQSETKTHLLQHQQQETTESHSLTLESLQTQIQSLQSSLTATTTENALLKSQQKDFTKSHSHQLETLTKQHQEALESLQIQHMNQLESTNTANKSTADAYKETLKTLAENLEISESTNRRYETEIETLGNEIKHQTSQIETVSNQSKHLQENNAALASKIESLGSEITALELANRDLELKIKVLELEEAVVGNDGDSQFQALETEYQQLSIGYYKAVADCKGFATTIKDLESNLKETTNSLESSINENKRQTIQISDLESHIHQLEESSSTKTQHLETVKLELQKLESKHQALMTQFADAKHALTTQHTTFTSSLESKKQLIESLQSEIHSNQSTIQSQKIESLQSEMESLTKSSKETTESLKQSKTTLQINISTLVAQLSDLQQQNTELQQELQKTRDLKDSEMQEWKDARFSLEMKLGAFEKAKKGALEQVAKAKVELDVKSDEARGLREEVDRLKEARRREEGVLLDMKGLVETLKVKLGKQQEAESDGLKQLQHENGSLKGMVKSQLARIQVLEDENRQYRLKAIEVPVAAEKSEHQRMYLQQNQNHNQNQQQHQNQQHQNQQHQNQQHQNHNRREGHVTATTPDPNDDMFDRWCNYRAGNKPNGMKRNHGSISLVQKRIAEYGEMKGNAANSDDGDAQLANRYQFLLKTVRNVKELFD
ncbi:UNVERIFIED_CONTAM: Kinesin-like protein kif21b [Siphonaria sp. JEL0065]|nr:Kinesin-like protein kif21b [Siphonaria sp. JEL0065]